MQHWAMWDMPWTSHGLDMTQLKRLAKQIGKDHELALDLWKHENCVKDAVNNA